MKVRFELDDNCILKSHFDVLILETFIPVLMESGTERHSKPSCL